MSDLRDFFSVLLDTLQKREKGSADFHNRFNNSKEYKRARTCSARTDLMLGKSDDREKGIVRTAFHHFNSSDLTGFELSFERYVDFIASQGDWWTGKKVALMTCEVESDLAEFKGTLSDLIRYQARQKVAVFYDNGIQSRREQMEGDVRDVFDHFKRQGFSEADDTEYLVVFGPEEIANGAIGNWCAMWFRYGSSNFPVWLTSS